MSERSSAEGQKVLVVMAHPDDPEFYCGGTMARWAAEGRSISYWLLTRGGRGSDDGSVDAEALAELRVAEQQAAARVLGVREVFFLDYPDGYLVADLALRKEIVRIVRSVRPEILVTSDPTNFFPSPMYINHPDHRAAGLATLDAVFPASGSGLFFPELEREEGLAPHKVRQLYVAGARDPNTAIDVTSYVERKVAALREHRSQIRDMDTLEKRIRSWLLDPESAPDSPRYIERFQRIDLG